MKKRKMSKHAEEIVRKVDATMRLEGMPLTDEEKEFIARVADGELTIDEAIAILNERFAVKEK